MTQAEMVLKHLLSGRTITPLEALRLFGSLRLSAIIYDLKKEGVEIKTKMVADPNTKKHFASYSIEPDDLFKMNFLYAGKVGGWQA